MFDTSFDFMNQLTVDVMTEAQKLQAAREAEIAQEKRLAKEAKKRETVKVEKETEIQETQTTEQERFIIEQIFRNKLL